MKNKRFHLINNLYLYDIWIDTWEELLTRMLDRPKCEYKFIEEEDCIKVMEYPTY